MKKFIVIFFTFLIFDINAEENLKFYLSKAIENNLELNAERKNLESVKQDKKISRSEFLPSITISGEQTSTTSTNRTNQSGASLADSNSDTENKNIFNTMERVLNETFINGSEGRCKQLNKLINNNELLCDCE